MPIDHRRSTSYEVTFTPPPALLKLQWPPASKWFLDFLGPYLTILGQFGTVLDSFWHKNPIDHCGTTIYEVTFTSPPALLKLQWPPASTRFLDYLGPYLTILGQFGPFLEGLGYQMSLDHLIVSL